MRFVPSLLLVTALLVFPAAGLRAQNVEVKGWRPSDWHLVSGPVSDVNSEARGSASPVRGTSETWVRWGVNESVAAVASTSGNLALRASDVGLPEGCGLTTGSSANIRAYSAECVAAAALARSRQTEVRGGLEWSQGSLSLSATAGFQNASLMPFAETFNALGALPPWLIDRGLIDRGLIDRGLIDRGLIEHGIRGDAALGPGGSVEVRSRDVAVRGDWRVNSAVSVHLLGSRGQLSAAASHDSTQRVSAEQTVLGFGVSRGDLRGVITGQRVVPLSPLRKNESVTALDLGVSWRTPWQGELTVGARELSRTAPAASDPAQAVKAREERTPYVQYRQDL